jgi:hypothetical protein
MHKVWNNVNPKIPLTLHLPTEKTCLELYEVFMNASSQKMWLHCVLGVIYLHMLKVWTGIHKYEGCSLSKVPEPVTFVLIKHFNLWQVVALVWVGVTCNNDNLISTAEEFLNSCQDGTNTSVCSGIMLKNDTSAEYKIYNDIVMTSRLICMTWGTLLIQQHFY